MYLNTIASGPEPVDLTQTDEFASLLQSADELGIDAKLPVRYQSRNVVVNRLRLHVLEWGEPASRPVLLLHGGNQTAHSWDLVSLSLAHHYHLIAVDLRGHGDSEWPRDGDREVTSMADDARLILNLLQLNNSVVIGHGLGVQVALALLLANPGIAKRAVLSDNGPELSHRGTARIGNFIQSAREFASIEEYMDRITSYDPSRSREHISRTMRFNIMQRVDGKLVSKVQPRPPAADGQAVRAPARPSLADMGRITCPILLLRGEHSDVLLPDAAQRFMHALPQATLVTVSNCGHNIHSQNTQGFLDAVVPFLDAG